MIRYSLGIARGLYHLHSYNYAHCDLKTDNILINIPGPEKPLKDQIDIIVNDSEPIIIDFGQATKFGDKPSGGNPLNNPPEDSAEFQIVTPKRDMFGVGCIIYMMVSGGQHPFDDFSPKSWNWNEEIPNPKYPLRKEGKRYECEKILFGKNSCISIEFENFIRRMISYLPEDRPSFEEVIQFLEHEQNSFK